MKFLTFTWYDASKATELATIVDKMQASYPPGLKNLGQYACLAIPFPGLPPNTIVSFSITEAESAEALAAISYPLVLAGATIHRVPILEIPVGGGAKVEKKFRGSTR